MTSDTSEKPNAVVMYSAAKRQHLNRSDFTKSSILYFIVYTPFIFLDDTQQASTLFDKNVLPCLLLLSLIRKKFYFRSQLKVYVFTGFMFTLLDIISCNTTL